MVSDLNFFLLHNNSIHIIFLNFSIGRKEDIGEEVRKTVTLSYKLVTFILD